MSGDVSKLKQPRRATKVLTFVGRTVTGVRWHQGSIVLDFDGPNLKSLVLATDSTYDEEGNLLDYEGTA